MPTFPTVERLLLAQAAHDHGAGDWQRVAGLVVAHPLWTTPNVSAEVGSSARCAALHGWR